MISKRPNVDFFGNGLCFKCSSARSELLEFDHFQDEAELAWASLEARVQERISEVLKKTPPMKHGDAIDSHTYELHQAQSKFPSIHRESVSVSLFGFVEHELISLANTVCESIEGELRPNDLRGKGIDQARRYLTKVADFDFSKMNEEWESLTAFRQIRNHIVHNAGFLGDHPKQSTIEFIEATPGIWIGSSSMIQLGAEFVHHMTGTLATFFEKLGGLVEDFIAG